MLKKKKKIKEPLNQKKKTGFWNLLFGDFFFKKIIFLLHKFQLAHIVERERESRRERRERERVEERERGDDDEVVKAKLRLARMWRNLSNNIYFEII